MRRCAPAHIHRCTNVHNASRHAAPTIARLPYSDHTTEGGSSAPSGRSQASSMSSCTTVGSRVRARSSSAGRPRWVRIARATTLSVIAVKSRSRPPQPAQVSTSKPYVRRSNCAHGSRGATARSPAPTSRHPYLGGSGSGKPVRGRRRHAVAAPTPLTRTLLPFGQGSVRLARRASVTFRSAGMALFRRSEAGGTWGGAGATLFACPRWRRALLPRMVYPGISMPR